MATEDDLQAVMDASAAVAKLNTKLDLATRIHKLVTELSADGKLAEASGALQALAVVTGA